MGTVYYLLREDTRTAYELGKSWELHHVFGAANCGSRFLLDDADTLAALIAHVEFEHETFVGDQVLRGHWDDTEDMRAYVKWIATDIVRWAEGQLVSFENEHSGKIEDLAMEGYDAGSNRKWVTGSRFRD